MGSKKQTNKINEQIKPNKSKQADTENRAVVTRGEGGRVVEVGKGEQLYSGRWKLNFWWGACCRVYRNRNMRLYT